jgi:hypothetical protein
MKPAYFILCRLLMAARQAFRSSGDTLWAKIQTNVANKMAFITICTSDEGPQRSPARSPSGATVRASSSASSGLKRACTIQGAATALLGYELK